MSVREAVGALARTLGSGQFSDKFGHENCIILAIHANPQLSIRAINALTTPASTRIGQCHGMREVDPNPVRVASLVNERVYSYAINRWARAAFGHFLHINAIATLLNHTRGKREVYVKQHPQVVLPIRISYQLSSQNLS
jgi:hypothetical protein